MTGHNDLISLQGKIKASSEVHPTTRKLILGPWDALAEKIGVPPGEKDFAELAIKAMERSASVADSGREFKECATIPVGGFNGMWFFLSALHKSVRFGLEKEAIIYYRSLVEDGWDANADSYVRKTILYENVGLGDPVLCEVARRAFSKATKAHKTVRLHLIRLACRANKSRIQTDVWQELTYCDVGAERLLEADDLNAGNAVEVVVAGEMTAVEVIAFGWLLLGTGATKKHMPKGKAPHRRSDLMLRTLKAMDLPEFLKETCFGALESKSPFWVSMAVLSCLYAEEWKAAPYPVDAMAVPFKVEKTGKFILPAIDQFTSSGKRAYNELRNSHPSYFKQNDGMELDMEMFAHDVFRAESEVLHNKVSSPSANHLYDEALDACWRIEGRDPAEARKSVRRINRNLEPLNAARRAVME